MRVLVTGATGFLGSEIVRQLRQRGVPLRATGRSLPAPQQGPDYWRMDLAESQCLEPLVQGVQTVIHCAGLAHCQASEDQFQRHNVLAAAKLFRAAARAGVQHLVHLSTVRVYGPDRGVALKEGDECHPENAYGQSKHRCEQVLAELASSTSVRLTMLRMTTLYGEKSRGDLARLMRAIQRGAFVWVGNGSNRKCLLHREDAARACILAVLRTPVAKVQVYNVCDPAYSMMEIVGEIATALERPLPRLRIPAGAALACARAGASIPVVGRRAAQVHQLIQKWLASDRFDASRFRRDFDFSAEVALADGLRREVAWHKGRVAETKQRKAA